MRDGNNCMMPNASTLVFSFLAQPAQIRVGEEDASIFSKTLCHTPKLVGLEGAMGYPIELHMPGQHFLKQLPQGVQKHNGPEHLEGGIGWLPRFWYYD